MTIIEKEFMETIVRNLPKLVREMQEINAKLDKLVKEKEKENNENK